MLKESQRGVIHGSAAGPTYLRTVGAATYPRRTATTASIHRRRCRCGCLFCCTNPSAHQCMERHLLDVGQSPGDHWWWGAALRGNGSHRSPTTTGGLAVGRWAHGCLGHVDDPRRGPISRNCDRVWCLGAHRIAPAVILWIYPVPGGIAYSAGADDWPVGIHGPGHTDRRPSRQLVTDRYGVGLRVDEPHTLYCFRY